MENLEQKNSSIMMVTLPHTAKLAIYRNQQENFLKICFGILDLFKPLSVDAPAAKINRRYK